MEKSGRKGVCDMHEYLIEGDGQSVRGGIQDPALQGVGRACQFGRNARVIDDARDGLEWTLVRESEHG